MIPVRRTTPWLAALPLAAGLFALSPPPAAVQAAATCEEWTAPARRARVANPLQATPAVIAQGREAYRRECLDCHGARGQNDGPEAKKDEMECAEPLTDASVRQQSDGALFWKISEGRDPMPAGKEVLAEREIWAVVHYIRTLQ